MLRGRFRQVAETLLQAHPEANAIYAHNDEMAMGAIAAIEAAVLDEMDRLTRDLATPYPSTELEDLLR